MFRAEPSFAYGARQPTFCHDTGRFSGVTNRPGQPVLAVSQRSSTQFDGRLGVLRVLVVGKASARSDGVGRSPAPFCRWEDPLETGGGLLPALGTPHQGRRRLRLDSQDREIGTGRSAPASKIPDLGEGSAMASQSCILRALRPAHRSSTPGSAGAPSQGSSRRSVQIRRFWRSAESPATGADGCRWPKGGRSQESAK